MAPKAAEEAVPPLNSRAYPEDHTVYILCNVNQSSSWPENLKPQLVDT